MLSTIGSSVWECVFFRLTVNSPITSSSVTTATDAAIREALRTHLKGSTKIIIAQRVASVCDADKIVVLSDGKIADMGTHDELMERSEIYREVYTSQQKGVE